MNPYFDIEGPHNIVDVEALLTLNVEKSYYRPGSTEPVAGMASLYSFAHSTAGVFRGQLHDWPLVPKAFRGLADEKKELTQIARQLLWLQATHQFRKFCERAEVQNPTLPSSIPDRMCIAQQFGVPTPLLDWSQSIFTAVFFAVRDVFADPQFAESGKVFVYHIIDERLLHDGLPDGELTDFADSAFVKPFHIDRRIERQRGVFTYHPHPTLRLEKVPARVYTLEWPLIKTVLGLMKGFGFTEDYFFPDYAGIARAVTSDTSL